MRQTVAERYNELLSGLIETPIIKGYNKSVWAQYLIRLPSRILKSKLNEQGIPQQYITLYPSLQECFKYLKYIW